MAERNATPQQWAEIQEWAELGGNSHACLLELRDRLDSQSRLIDTLWKRVEALQVGLRDEADRPCCPQAALLGGQ